MMIKSVKLSQNTWFEIKQDLRTKHPPSVFLSREKMKKVLGFTDRSLYDYREYPNRRILRNRRIQLDFFDEKKKIMFLLSYGDKISPE
jgi:hypothetical protein